MVGGGGGRRARGKEINNNLTLSTTNKLFLCEQNSDEALI